MLVSYIFSLIRKMQLGMQSRKFTISYLWLEGKGILSDIEGANLACYGWEIAERRALLRERCS